jgi:hypothetical protein
MARGILMFPILQMVRKSLFSADYKNFWLKTPPRGGDSMKKASGCEARNRRRYETNPILQLSSILKY